MEIPSVNENNSFTAPQHSMHQLDKVLPWLIDSVDRAPVDDGNMLFSKLDIKDGYWRIIVERDKHLNFAYVLPNIPGARIRIFIPSALQIRWSESPPFFCIATETPQGLAEDNAERLWGSLAPHPLEDIILLLDKWPEEELVAICNKYLHVM